MHFTILQKVEKHHGAIVNLLLETIQYPSGRTTVREIVEHPGGAVILPVFENGDILLIRQYRHPLKGEIVELPAGKLDPNEDPQRCASRELEEETGYSARHWTKLTSILTTPGFCNERLHIFMAQDLVPTPTGQKLEEGEQSLKIERVPMREAVRRIEQGELQDGKTIVGILMGERALAS